MGILGTATKYKFEGIGKASATLTFAALASQPGTVWATQGVPGKITFFLLTWLYMGLASIGLVVLNVGVANIKTLMEKESFDGSFDEAFRIINAKGGKLTDAEKAEIDGKVIDAFRDFATFGKRSN